MPPKKGKKKSKAELEEERLLQEAEEKRLAEAEELRLAKEAEEAAARGQPASRRRRRHGRLVERGTVRPHPARCTLQCQWRDQAASGYQAATDSCTGGQAGC